MKDILSRPLILDILTLPDVLLPPEAIPSIMTEIWLLEWFCKEVVRLAEKFRYGRGSPDKREQLLLHIAMESLKGNKFVAIRDGMDSEAVSGLVSDRLLVKDGNSLHFAHDVLELINSFYTKYGLTQNITHQYPVPSAMFQVF